MIYLLTVSVKVASAGNLGRQAACMVGNQALAAVEIKAWPERVMAAVHVAFKLCMTQMLNSDVSGLPQVLDPKSYAPNGLP